MLKKRPGRSVRRTVLLPMLAIAVIQILIFSIVFWSGNTFSNLKNNALHLLSQTAADRRNYLNAEMSDNANTLSSFQENINQDILSFAAEKNIDLHTPGQEQAEHILAKTIDSLITLQGSSHVAGAFIILDSGGTSSFQPSLYLRDLSPETRSTDNSDLMMLAGNPALVKDYGIALDSSWTYALDLSTLKDASFYQKPFQAALEYPALGAKALGYWSNVHQISGDGIDVISYTMPLLDQSHQPYGVIGIDLSVKYLQQFLKYSEGGSNGKLGYMLFLDKQNGPDAYEISFINGREIKNAFTGQTTFSLGKELSYRNTYELEVPSGDAEMVGCVQNLQLYNTNTPFISEQWNLMEISQKSALFADANSIEKALVISFLVALLISLITAVFLSAQLIRPIHKLIKGLRESDPSNPVELPKVHINEIDEISEAVEILSENVAAAASQLDQIIKMVNLPIGALEYSTHGQILFCTDNLAQLLNLPQKVLNDQSLLSQQISVLLNSTVPDSDASSDSSLCELDNGHWIRFNRAESGENILLVVTDVTEEIEEKKQIEHERDYDLLTNLLNRRAFERELGKILPLPEGELGAMIMWDMDNLKFINDTYGHDYGDRSLKALARVLSRLEGYSSKIARLSGDEFVVFLHGFESKQEIRDLLLKTHQTLGETFISLPHHEQILLKASAGISWYPENGDTYSVLLSHADMAMYHCKHSSKGMIQEFSKITSHQSGDESCFLRMELDKLFEEAAVKYAFQPVVDTHSGEIFGVEALMRPQTELLKQPKDIIHMTKISSQPYQLERTTWFCALRDFAPQAELLPKAKLFLNSLPSVLLNHRDYQYLQEMYAGLFGRIVVELSDEKEVDASNLLKKIELAQKGNMQFVFQATDLMKPLPDLKSYHYFKIDRSSILDVCQDDKKYELLQDRIHQLHQLGIKIIAVGIQSQEELKRMLELDIDYVQGFYLSKPQFHFSDLPDSIKEEIRRLRDQNDQK